jgi:energy-coupling factor transport system ATP-binding protein
MPVKVRLTDVRLTRGSFTLRCTAAFKEGVHLVSGPVGSGKSSLAFLIASLLQPDGGSIRRDGISSALLSLQFPEHHVTCPTVADEVGSWGLDPDLILPAAGLLDRSHADPFHLSRGELKRLNLICTIAREPDLLLLDEPFSSLDCSAKQQACTMIEERKSGITIIFSHERSVLPRVDAIWEMERGELLSLGEVPEGMLRWRSAPSYIRYALDRGILPANVRLADAREAICRIRD